MYEVKDASISGPPPSDQLFSNSRILLTGSSGMLGTAVAKELRMRGAHLLHLVRRDPQQSDELRWNPSASGASAVVDSAKLEGLTAAIHLSGANVAGKRWTAAYKREIVESRVGTTKALSEVLSRLRQPPRVLVSASAIGLYGDRGDEILDENSPAGKGFFPELCQDWERATLPAERAGIRVVHPRFGVVLGPDGGALKKLLPMFRLGLGGQIGNGRQWVSWVSEADAVGAILFALRNGRLRGSVNAVAPEPVTNAEFTRELAHAVHRPALLPVPAFALKMVFGQMAEETLLSSTRVLAERLPEAGFIYAYPTLAGALASAVKAKH